MFVPREVTREGLPPIFEVGRIGSAKLLAIEFFIYEGTIWRLIKRISCIIYPFPFKNIAPTRKLSAAAAAGIVVILFSICCLLQKHKYKYWQEHGLEHENHSWISIQILVPRTEGWGLRKKLSQNCAFLICVYHILCWKVVYV